MIAIESLLYFVVLPAALGVLVSYMTGRRRGNRKTGSRLVRYGQSVSWLTW